MRTVKLSFAVALLLAALVGGWYLANYLVLLLLGLRDAPQAWNLWRQYFQVKELPSFAPYATLSNRGMQARLQCQS